MISNDVAGFTVGSETYALLNQVDLYSSNAKEYVGRRKTGRSQRSLEAISTTMTLARPSLANTEVRLHQPCLTSSSVCLILNTLHYHFLSISLLNINYALLIVTRC